MGLVDLTTDLKSLRYSKDRVGGGSSNQPYITRDLPGNPNLPFSDDSNKDLSGVDRSGGPDVILRGGTLAPGRAARDVSRLTQMFFDFKSIGGPLFIAKENLLSRTSVATDGKGKALNNGVYLPTSTLLQSAGNSLGLHLNKQGIDPFKGIGQNGGGIFELFGGSDPLGQPTYVEITTNPNYESKLIDFKNNVLNTNKTTLYSYQGGPGAVLGIGKTSIRRFNDQNTVLERNYKKLNFGWNKPALDIPTSLSDASSRSFRIRGGLETGVDLISDQPTPAFYIGSKYENFRDQTALEKLRNQQLDPLGVSVKFAENNPKDQSTIKLNWNDKFFGNNQNAKIQPSSYTLPTQENPSIQEDFRIKSDDPKTKAFRLDYTRQNIEQRVGLGNPGKKKSKEQLANYQEGIGELDKINSLRLYKSGVVTSNTDKNDLVKFRIGIIQNDNPSEKIFIHFRAFLDSMSDDYSADWGSEKLMGRGENFYRYNGFDRKISLGWTVVAQSKDELIPMYQKLNYLASTLAPDYSKSLGYMRGNLATLTVGGYLYEQPGIITSLNYSVPEESPWEIAIPTKKGADSNNDILSDKSVKEMPHMIKVTGFNFIPIHEFVPRTQQNKFNSDGKLTSFGKERYIALDNGVNSNYDNENYIK
ncbi:hypothetical protein N8579_00025 [bacterium]|nr:hypothetical protein [bacterium]